MKYLSQDKGFHFDTQIEEMRTRLDELERAKKLFEEKFPEDRFPNLLFNFELMGNILRKPRLDVVINVSGDNPQFYFTYNFDNKHRKSLVIGSLFMASMKNMVKLTRNERARYFFNYLSTYNGKHVDFEFIQEYFETVVPEFNKNPDVDYGIKLLQTATSKLDMRKDF